MYVPPTCFVIFNYQDLIYLGYLEFPVTIRGFIHFYNSRVLISCGSASTYHRNAQDLDRFLSNNESLLDVDIVAWVSVGREHITRQEDLPLVSNFGASFSLQPWRSPS